jgi:5-methylcytosine-specific restriction endonuclease McrA
VTRRAFISTKRRLALFASKHGVCHLCGGKIIAPEAWDVSHVIPLELGGADDESNWDVAHRKCHRVHTATKDIPDIAKAKRRERKLVQRIVDPPKLKGGPFPTTRKAAARKANPKSPLPKRPIYGDAR